jgi:predicted phosphoadenosine phosphosulfate sulfurtransferase
MLDKILKYIKKWEARGYAEGIPDEADAKLEGLGKVPSYRMICKAILKNDIALTSLGYNRPKTDSYNILKRIELAERKAKNERTASGE